MNKLRTRLWDEQFNLLYDSATDPRTVEEFMVDHQWLTVTQDYADGSWRNRQGGRLVKTSDGSLEFHSAREYLQYIVANPIPVEDFQ